MAQTTLRHWNLRYSGGYTDVYTDIYGPAEHLHIVARKMRKSFTDSTFEVSSIFEGLAELEEHPDIWAAVAAVWAARNTYGGREGLIIAMDDALALAGYTAPGGAAL